MNFIKVEAHGKTFKLPTSHPHLLQLRIDPLDWHRFNQLPDDNPAVRIIGHDAPDGGLIPVRVACASDEVTTGWKTAGVE